MPVVAPGELHDQPTARGRPGQPDRGHDRLGARGGEAHPLDRGDDTPHDRLGQLELGQARGAEGRRAGDRRLDRGDDLGVGVTEDHRPPAADEVDIRPAVDVDDPRALRRGDEPGHTPTAPKARTGEDTHPA